MIDSIRQSLAHERPVEFSLRFRIYHVVLVLVLAVGFLWRAAGLTDNALFVDEAIYARVGEGFLVGRDTSNALSYMFGSFLYPAISALAVDAGGVYGARMLSVILSLVAGLYVSFAVRRLFGDAAGAGAALIFLINGPSISLGQHAVYDALAMVLLSAALHYTLVAAGRDRSAALYFLLAGICFGLAVLAKYIAIAVLPALAAYTFLGRLHIRGRFDVLRRPGWILALVGAAAVVGPYLYLNLPVLQSSLSGQFASQIVPRVQLVQTLLFDSGLILLLTALGLWQWHTALRNSTQSRRAWVPVVILAISISILLAYHLLTSNGRSFWKHEVLTLVFLAPVAGLAGARTLEAAWLALEGGRTARGALLLLALAAGGLWAVGSAAVSNNSFHLSWPNFSPAVHRIEWGLRLRPDAQVLASAASIYETYLFPDQPDPNGWRDTWGFDYNSVWGAEGMLNAVRDCALAAVILDDYYTPQITAALTPALEDAGYELDFEDWQPSAAGYPNRITIYVPGDTGACGAQTQG